MSTPTRHVAFGRPWIFDAERAAARSVLEGSVLTHGPQCAAFESEFAAFLGGSAHAVAVSSGMAALHLAFLHAGVRGGDDVILPAQTHVATAHAAELVGARCVFVDCDPLTGNVTPEQIEAAITPRTKAIAVVHFVGIPCRMREIAATAERRGVFLIEDCALAVGARHDGTHVGLFGHAGCFSFYPAKHMTTGEGGMFVSREQATASAVARVRAFGVDRTYRERAAPGIYDVTELGLNYRMGEMQAAIGRVQVGRLAEMLARRDSNFAIIRDAVSRVPGVTILDGAGNSHYCLVLVLDPDREREDRDAVVATLQRSGIETSVYYPHPVPRLRYYRDRYGYDGRQFPAAERISDRSIALPVGPHLSPGDAEYVGERTARALSTMCT